MLKFFLSMMSGAGFEPTKPKALDLKSSSVDRLDTLT